MRIYNPTITGSLTLSGSIIADRVQEFQVTSASYAITASHALNSTSESSSFATTASFAVTASYAISASHEIKVEISSSHADTATSASHAVNSNLAKTASYVSAASVDGTVANATTSSYALTASFALNAASGGTVDTGSLLKTGSVSSNVLTFTKGDGTTFDLTVATGSGGSVDTGSLLITASASTNVITFTKGDSSTFAITVDTGSGGGTTETLEYNGQVRYEIVSGSSKAQIVSTGNVYKNLSWSRSSTTLTVNSTGHGLSTGDNVLIRNMSEDYELKRITTSGADAFTCTVADSGDTSGTSGAYIPAFDCSAIDLTTGEVTVTAPGAGDLQINSMMVYAPSSEVDPITVNIPAGDSNSGGINSALDTRFPPLVTFYKLDQASPVLSTTTTVTYSKTANFAQYSVGGGSPDTFGAVQFILRF